MRSSNNLSLGNKIAIISLVVATVTLFFGVYQHVSNKNEVESRQNKGTSIVAGDNSAIVNNASGDVEINYSSEKTGTSQ